MPSFQLAINGSPEFAVTDVADLRRQLQFVQAEPSAEIMLTRDDGSFIIVLTNASRAVVTFSLESEIENFNSLDPSAPEPEHLMPFRMSNGCIDEYPASSTVPTPLALDAILVFFCSGIRSEAIQWSADDPFQTR